MSTLCLCKLVVDEARLKKTTSDLTPEEFPITSCFRLADFQCILCSLLQSTEDIQAGQVTDHAASHVEEVYKHVPVHAIAHHQPMEAKTARVLAELLKREHAICTSVSLLSTQRELVKMAIVILVALGLPELPSLMHCMAAKQKASAKVGTGRGAQIVELEVRGQRSVDRVKVDPAAEFMQRTTYLEILAGEHQNTWKSNTDAKVKLFSGLQTFQFT